MVGRTRTGFRTLRPRAPRSVSLWTGLVSGIGAGIIAAAVDVAIVRAAGSRLPPLQGTAGSALGAGVLGGLVYSAWSRLSPRPRAALWVTVLLIATADTIVVFTLPFPTAARHVHVVALAGLLTPALQLLALAGIGHSSPGHLPAAYHGVYAAVHYATAVVVSLLVPVFARSRAG